MGSGGETFFSDGCRRDGRGMKGLGGGAGILPGSERRTALKAPSIIYCLCVFGVLMGLRPSIGGGSLVTEEGAKDGAPPPSDGPFSRTPTPDQTLITSPICPLCFSLPASLTLLYARTVEVIGTLNAAHIVCSSRAVCSTRWRST